MRPSIIGISGKIEAGKDTFARLLLEHPAFHDYKQFAFADGVKEVVQILTGDSDQWSREGKAKTAPGFGQSNGLLQQLVGAGMRNMIDSDVWVRSCMNRIADYRKQVVNRSGGVVITDVRYPGEVLAIQDAGGIVIRIERLTNGIPHVPVDDGRDLKHESETALDPGPLGRWEGLTSIEVKFDHELLNEGDLKEYEIRVKLLLEGILHPEK